MMKEEGTIKNVPSSFQRTLKIFGVLLVTLSYITPACSIFIIAPIVLQQAGTGAFLSFLAAAIVSLLIAFVYAELSSAYPYSGGEYTIVGRVMGSAYGFITFGLSLVTGIFGLSILALGIATYLTPFIPDASPIPTAVIMIVATTLLGILHVRTNAFITGLFLTTEILMLVVITVLGFTHSHRPFIDLLLSPHHLGASGGIEPTTFSMIGMATSVAIFSYNGYGQAVYLGEETQNPRHHIARAILWALFIAVVAEALPVTALLLGAPDLPAFLGSPTMISSFVQSLGGNTTSNAMSLGIVLAIINASIAVILFVSRVLFSSARDHAWWPAANKALIKIHPKYNSPWVATLACGVLAALSCLIDPQLLFVMTGTGLVAIYSLLCIAALVGRHKNTTAHRAYNMLLYPLAPLLALAAMGYVGYANFLDTEIGRPSLWATLAIILVSAAYYALVLRRRGQWILHVPKE